MLMPSVLLGSHSAFGRALVLAPAHGPARVSGVFPALVGSSVAAHTSVRKEVVPQSAWFSQHLDVLSLQVCPALVLQNWCWFLVSHLVQGSPTWPCLLTYTSCRSTRDCPSRTRGEEAQRSTMLIFVEPPGESTVSSN